MFDQSFVHPEPTSNKPMSIAVSLLLQLSLLSVAALVPLFYNTVLPMAQLKNILLAPPPPKPVAPHIAPVHTVNSPLRSVFNVASATPFVVPKSRTQTDLTPPPDLDGFASPISGDVASGAGPVIPGSLGIGAPPALAVPSLSRTAPPKEVRVSSLVAEANLLKKVQPVYPSLAKNARIQGAVEFTAIISKEGNIEKLQLIHGHPLLVPAARDAILQWKYRPTMLNGQPVEVVTSILVNFTLAQ